MIHINGWEREGINFLPFALPTTVPFGGHNVPYAPKRMHTLRRVLRHCNGNKLCYVFSVLCLPCAGHTSVILVIKQVQNLVYLDVPTGTNVVAAMTALYLNFN